VKEKITQKNQNPFWTAFNAAQKINTQKPGEDQSEEFGLLEASIAKLDKETQKRLVFLMAKKVLEGNLQIQPLFAVARIAKMITVAYNASVIKKATEEGLTFSDLCQVGLAEIRKREDGKPSITYRLGKEALKEASQKLRMSGKINSAKIIEDHLRRGERNKALAEAAATA